MSWAFSVLNFIIFYRVPNFSLRSIFSVEMPLLFPTLCLHGFLQVLLWSPFLVIFSHERRFCIFTAVWSETMVCVVLLLQSLLGVWHTVKQAPACARQASAMKLQSRTRVTVVWSVLASKVFVLSAQDPGVSVTSSRVCVGLSMLPVLLTPSIYSDILCSNT